MKYKNIIIAVILIAGGVIVGLWLKPAQSNLGATGSQFNIQHEWITGGHSDEATITSTQVATTSPIVFTTDISTSTVVTLLTAGVSDLRINLIVSNASTSAIAGTEITIGYKIAGFADDNFYQESTISSGAVNLGGYTLWAFATTSGVGVNAFDSTSLQFNNMNTPKMQFEFGSNEQVDLSVEFVKIYPN